MPDRPEGWPCDMFSLQQTCASLVFIKCRMPTEVCGLCIFAGFLWDFWYLLWTFSISFSLFSLLVLKKAPQNTTTWSNSNHWLCDSIQSQHVMSKYRDRSQFTWPSTNSDQPNQVLSWCWMRGKNKNPVYNVAAISYQYLNSFCSIYSGLSDCIKDISIPLGCLGLHPEAKMMARKRCY